MVVIGAAGIRRPVGWNHPHPPSTQTKNLTRLHQVYGNIYVTPNGNNYNEIMELTMIQMSI